ncbi:MAG: hypothetical protein KTR26_09890, partial [Flammeovirgaceae bacterium]|nr:hypothetical protein [Flammeovirgaceae bacterium]
MENKIYLYFRAIIFSSLFLMGFQAVGQGDFDIQTGSTTSGCGPLTVLFEPFPDAGKTVDSYSWDLGNGSSSTLEEPATIYITNGQYDVSLTIFYDDGTNETINKNSFIDVFAGPTPSFSASTTGGCLPLTVDFSNTTIAGDAALDSTKTV